MQQAPPGSHSVHNLIQENSRALAFAWHCNITTEVKLDFHKFLGVLHKNLSEFVFNMPWQYFIHDEFTPMEFQL